MWVFEGVVKVDNYCFWDVRGALWGIFKLLMLNRNLDCHLDFWGNVLGTSSLRLDNFALDNKQNYIGQIDHPSSQQGPPSLGTTKRSAGKYNGMDVRDHSTGLLRYGIDRKYPGLYINTASDSASLNHHVICFNFNRIEGTEERAGYSSSFGKALPLWTPYRTG